VLSDPAVAVYFDARLPLITGLVTATAYADYIEVEIFSRAAWDAPGR
jgi:hypothetical protein